MPDHSCYGKIREIKRRTNEELNHEEISRLCNLWRCRDPEDFYSIMNSLTDGQLRVELEKIRKKRMQKEEELLIYS
ncbi:MAG: hypothetical protein ACRECH_00540 [Nitrososphaerales archaeon]